MADNLKERGARDRARVNVNEPHEVRYWSERFKCSEAELREAVKAAGVMAADVEKRLKGSSKPR